jgi:hypothetical protein
VHISTTINKNRNPQTVTLTAKQEKFAVGGHGAFPVAF